MAEEARGLLGAEITTMLHFEDPGSATLVAGSGAPYSELPNGSRVPTGPGTIGALVRASGRVERLERFDPDAGALAAYLHRLGISSAVGAPIAVQGRAWGMLLAGASVPLPARTEARLAEFAELAAVAVANAESRAELAGSRARIVTAADEARRRIERDLHDGIQQRLVSLGLELRAAQSAIDERPREAQRRIDAVAGGLTRTIDDLREISRGIHPASLAGGLVPGAQGARTPLRPSPSSSTSRGADPVADHTQVAIYYVVSEALTNASKHAHASVVRLSAARGPDIIRVAVTDDGIGGADPQRGSGLIGLSDRVGALGGTLTIESRPGQGTAIVAELPGRSAARRGPARRGELRPVPVRNARRAHISSTSALPGPGGRREEWSPAAPRASAPRAGIPHGG